jgi:hypothetical protein
MGAVAAGLGPVALACSLMTHLPVLVYVAIQVEGVTVQMCAHSRPLPAARLWKGVTSEHSEEPLATQGIGMLRVLGLRGAGWHP